MHNPKLDVLQRQSAVERLFGKEGAAPADPADAGEKHEEDSALVRKSYCILRGRIEVRPVLKVMNRQGEIRLFPWSYFAGANMNHPGELVLLFEGAESSSAITVSGRGLDRELLEGIEANRVAWIRELDELVAASLAAAEPAEPVVTGIHVKEGGVSREWSRGAGPSR
jgi:hypothetical protein